MKFLFHKLLNSERVNKLHRDVGERQVVMEQLASQLGFGYFF